MPAPSGFAPRPPHTPWRPERCEHVALVLQGGGALGAYQGGVYQALHEAGLEPDRVVGVSIGAINAAIIAGNPPERRLERLRSFWERITARPIWPIMPDGDDMRRMHNAHSTSLTMAFGQPGFFGPRAVNPWLAPRGSRDATSFYDTAPLARTLAELVDFDFINQKHVEFACGAVNVASGNYFYFDNTLSTIVPEHVMASGALPPALPMVRIGTDCWWDGGIVSNTPLQYLLDTVGSRNMLAFQVDLFASRGGFPRDMPSVLTRQKDIQYSSRTRLVTDVYRRMHKAQIELRGLYDRIPDKALSAAERVRKAELADLPEIALLQLIYQRAPYEDQSKDYEFSAVSMREHWEAGYRDTERTLRRKDWLIMPDPDHGIVAHDIHRADE